MLDVEHVLVDIVLEFCHLTISIESCLEDVEVIIQATFNDDNITGSCEDLLHEQARQVTLECSNDASVLLLKVLDVDIQKWKCLTVLKRYIVPLCDILLENRNTLLVLLNKLTSSQLFKQCGFTSSNVTRNNNKCLLSWIQIQSVHL